MINGVIYARYSCDKQTENSILGQVRDCQEFARRNDINIIGVYKDEAKSGRETAHRPGFLKMIKDAETGLFRRVIVWKGDRFSRSRADAARFKGELNRLGVRVLSATEANVEGAQAILMDGINEAFAEYFSVELAEKVERGMIQNAIDGKFNGGKMAFGFRLDENRKIIIDEVEGPIVQEIFRRYAYEETSFTQICEDLYQRGVRRKDGSVLRKSAVADMFSNQKYIGIYEFKGTVNKSMYPPIVTQEIYDVCAAKLRRNKQMGGRFSAREKFLLTGKLFCGECRSMMTSTAGVSQNGKMFKYYKCKKTSKKNNCGTTYRKEALEAKVIQAVLAFLRAPGNIDVLTKQLIRYQDQGNPELKLLKKRINDLDLKIERLNYALSEGIDFDSTVQQLKDFKDARNDLIRQLNLITINAKLYSPQAFKDALLKLAEREPESEDDKRKLLGLLVTNIFVYKDGRLQIVFNPLYQFKPFVMQTNLMTSTGEDHQILRIINILNRDGEFTCHWMTIPMSEYHKAKKKD